MRFSFRLSPRARRRSQRYWNTFKWYAGYPAWWLGSFFRFVGLILTTWWRNRNFRYLLQGLPAVLCTLGTMLFGLLVHAQDRNSLTDIYRNQGIRSLQALDRLRNAGEETDAALAMAETCFQRLNVLQDTSENRFRLAHILELKKQSAAAIQMVRSLAPDTRVGYGPAHVAVGKMYLVGAIPPPEGTSAARAAEMHFLRAVQSKDGATAAHYYLFDLYRLWNMPVEAEMHLEAAAKANPEFRLHHAAWCLAQGKPDKAKLHASTAAEVFRLRIEANPDDHSSRLQYGDALIMVGNYPLALETLRIGATLTQSQPQLQAQYAVKSSAVFIAWHDAKLGDPKTAPGECIAMLESALKWYPNNRDAYQRMLTFIRQKGPDSAKARQIVRDLALKGESSFLAHLFLGIDAWQENNTADARHHWEKAFELSDGAPLVANNLAWLVAFSEPSDLPRALSMIDAAIAKVPNDARYRGTRGHILAKLGRHQEALPELEKSIPVYQNDEKLFRQLADTCRQLNMPKSADDYRHRADEIVAKSKAAPQPRNVTADDKLAGPQGDKPAPAENKAGTPAEFPPARPSGPPPPTTKDGVKNPPP